MLREFVHKDLTYVNVTPEELLAHGVPAEVVEAARLDALRSPALARLGQLAADTRASIAGTSDPAKLAEYADKGLTAQPIIDGKASQDLVDAAETELASLKAMKKLPTKAAVADLARLWLDRAASLRRARAQVGALERQAEAAIKAATDEAAIAIAFDAFRAGLSAA